MQQSHALHRGSDSHLAMPWVSGLDVGFSQSGSLRGLAERACRSADPAEAVGKLRSGFSHEEHVDVWELWPGTLESGSGYACVHVCDACENVGACVSGLECTDIPCVCKNMHESFV